MFGGGLYSEDYIQDFTVFDIWIYQEDQQSYVL